MKLKLGFSPCPNDTFLFDALVHGRIDTEGLEFEVVMDDVEALNKMAVKRALHITKLSYHAFGYVSSDYLLLNSGSALGSNCGPLLISKRAMDPGEINQARIAIPGKMTTANFLFSLEYPKAVQKVETRFDRIESGVLDGEFDAGVIIHENRFTYKEKGLVKIADLGERWESRTGYPIPLGGIAIQRSLPMELQLKVDRLIKKSVAYAFEHPDASADFVTCHAQEMEKKVMRQHIDLYVNNYTLDLGERGRAAVEFMLQRATQLGLIADVEEPFILDRQ